MTPQKTKFRSSYVWWAITIAAFVIGVILAIVGVIIELNLKDTVGLIMVILSPLLLAASGIFSTVAAKFESEKR